MPRGKYSRKTRIAIPSTPEDIEVNAIVPPESMNTLKGWDKLNAQEQKEVLDAGHKLAKAMLEHGRSRLAIGEHLSRLQGILEPHNLFGRFVKGFNFSVRTAYRYIKGYQNAQGRLPEQVLKVAMARGINIIGDTELKPLGVYTDAVAKLPVPQVVNEEQATTYLNQLEDVRKQLKPSGAMFTMPEPQDPQTLLKECYRFVSLRYKRLPQNSKTRQAWVRSLVGMLLADLGVTGQQAFIPTTVPEDFRAQRGRPATAVAASA